MGEKWNFCCCNGEKIDENLKKIKDIFSNIFQRGNEIVFGTVDKNFHQLKTALSLLDYTGVKYFLSVREIYRPMVLQIVKEKNLQVVHDEQTIMKHMKKEEAKKLVVK